MSNIIKINKENIDSQHICCAFSDKKCAESYEAKKQWLKGRFDDGYHFYRLDERAKVFLEFEPAETAWLPIHAPNFLNLNCLWVSGRYKKQGYAKQLLQKAIEEAKATGKEGLVTVVGKKKMHFISDGKWFLKQGFKVIDSSPIGFNLLMLSFSDPKENPRFIENKNKGDLLKHGVTVYYSYRCPFASYHVNTSLIETLKSRNIAYQIVHLDTMEKAQKCPSPATIFSLFYNGEFITTDLSACLDSRFDKLKLTSNVE